MSENDYLHASEYIRDVLYQIKIEVVFNFIDGQNCIHQSLKIHKIVKYKLIIPQSQDENSLRTASVMFYHFIFFFFICILAAVCCAVQ